MRSLAFIIAVLASTCASAQSAEGPCGSREQDEVMARMKELGRRLADVQAELNLLQNDTTIAVPEGRAQRIDSLQAIRTKGKHMLLELDRKLISLQAK